VRKQLENPAVLFNLPKAAGCVVSTQELNSPLFGDKPEAEHDDDDDDHATADKDAPPTSTITTTAKSTPTTNLPAPRRRP